MSRPLPIKKRVKKKSPLYLLECSYTTAYKKFRKFNRDKVGYVAFVKLKPKNVRQLKPSERIVCCCIKCENTKLSIQSLNLASLKLDGFDLKLDSEWDCSDLTVCQYDTFPAQECLKRNCSNCGIDKISEHYSPLINSHGQEEIKTNKWKYVKETRKVRNVEKVVTSVQLITEKKKISQVIFELETEAKELSSHLFRAKWQQTMFAKAKEEMQPKSAVMVLDFAENYTCSLQSEVQSHHWSLNQVTVHPVVAFVNASETAGPYTNISTMIFITADRKHDSAAVQVFTEKSVQELKAKFETERFVEFTDCCAGQYRGKSAFADLSFLSKDLQIERHFFESSHGKSSADGMSAVVKHAATKAVTNNEIIIRNAEEFYLFCEKNLKQVGDGVFQSEAVKYKNSVRTFHLIDIEEIEQYRRSPGRNVKPVKGTMKVHSVRGIRPYEVKLRDISCFCSNCTTNNDNPCQNSEVAGAWRSVRLQTDNKESDSNAQQDGQSNEASPDDSVSGSESIPSSRVALTGSSVDPEIGQFVRITLTSYRGLPKDFVARILEKEGELFKVAYMNEKQVANKSMFFWPEKEDTSWEPKSQIKAVLNSPVLSSKSSSRNLLFYFE